MIINLLNANFSFYHSSNDDSDKMIEIFCMTENDEGLQSFLERDYHYRLHIHTRDFEAGRTIFGNIEEAITCSRRLIVILSR